MGLRPDDPYPDFSTYEPEMIEELQHFFSPRGSYKDAYPLHFVTSASLATLESYHPGLDVTPRRFRPNFYIEGVEGGSFPELDWSGYDLVIGDAVLNCGEETVRCVMPSQAQMGLKAEPHMGFVLNRVTKLKFGAYCHIRKAGTISVGDEVFLERRPKFQPMHSKLLPLPENIARGEVATPPPLTPFYKARLVRKQRETADTTTFGFKMQERQVFPFLPGQHLIFRLTPAGYVRPIMRSYSLSSASGAEDGAEDYAITVQRIGAGSGYLHNEVEVGAELDVRWPSGRFFCVPEFGAPIALISNGIGITPLFNMLQTIARVNPARKVFWMHATRNSTTHVFKREIAKLVGRLSDFHEWTIYRQPEAGDVSGRDYHSSERIAPEHFSTLVNLPDLEAFICGSESFTSVAHAMVRELGLREEQIHTEKFFSTLRQKAFDGGRRANAKTYAIHFERSGVEAEWTGGDPTLLEIAEQAGIPADYGCRFGACLACSIPVVKGEVKYADPEVVPKPGEVLVCCAEPTSDLLDDGELRATARDRLEQRREVADHADVFARSRVEPADRIAGGRWRHAGRIEQVARQRRDRGVADGARRAFAVAPPARDFERVGSGEAAAPAPEPGGGVGQQDEAQAERAAFQLDRAEFAFPAAVPRQRRQVQRAHLRHRCAREQRFDLGDDLVGDAHRANHATGVESRPTGPKIQPRVLEHRTPFRTMTKHTHAFQAEVKQILHLVTHSLYSNKEIFLRELVSNASDACDKLRFEALDDPTLFEDQPNLEVRVFFDADAKTLTIRDNGVGMSAEEAASNLGTIARSGTREFVARLEGEQKKDANLIGQFGVGFYSGFIVADRITVESRRAGLPHEEGVRWTSEGSGEYDLETITRAARGTDVILHLKADEI